MCPWDSLLRFRGCPGCPCWRENLAQRHPGNPETPAKRHWLAIQEIVAAGWSGRSAVQKLGAEIFLKKNGTQKIKKIDSNRLNRLWPVKIWGTGPTHKDSPAVMEKTHTALTWPTGARGGTATGAGLFTLETVPSAQEEKHGESMSYWENHSKQNTCKLRR